MVSKLFSKYFVANQKGFSLTEVLVTVFILALTAGPFIFWLSNLLHEYQTARERTRAIFLAQSILEPLLDPTLHYPIGQETFQPCPGNEEYEYRISVTPYLGSSLNVISVELRLKDTPGNTVVLTTLKARRKLHVWERL